MTKEQTTILMRYMNATATKLSGVYKNVGKTNLVAYENIMQEMKKREGFDFKIISANNFCWTCAYEYEDELGNEHLRYYSSKRTLDFIID